MENESILTGAVAFVTIKSLGDGGKFTDSINLFDFLHLSSTVNEKSLTA